MYWRNWLEEMDQIGGGCGRECCSTGREILEKSIPRIIMITQRRERLRIRKDGGSWRIRSSLYYKDLSRILAIFLVILSVGSSMAVMAYQNDLSGIASSSSSTRESLESQSVQSSSNRLGCVWSRTESVTNRKSNSASVTLNNGNNGQQSNTMYAPGNNPFEQRQTFSTLSTQSLSPSLSSSSSSSSSSSFTMEGGTGAGGMLTLTCNVRTLNSDFSNYTSAGSFTREQLEQARVARLRCSDKLFFQSFLYPNQTLFQLRNLRELEVDSCKIRKVPKAVFSSWRFLKKLEIHTNNYQWASSVGLELEEGAFQGLDTLEVLDLSQSNIWTLFPEPNILCPMRNLMKLNVSWNRLTDIDEFRLENHGKSREDPKDDSLHCTLNIQNVDLSHNFLRKIENSGFSRLPRMVELNLQNNLVEELEDKAFSGIPALKHLDLSSNRLVTLPSSIFSKKSGGPGNLQQVLLGNNSISALSPKVFEGLDQLFLLDLSRNLISSFPEHIFSGLVRIIVLKLSHNQLNSIPETLFSDLISLQVLTLDNNNIQEISPEAFQNLRNLNTIDLSHNKITSIDSKHFSSLFVLKQLFLDHNELETYQIHPESFKNTTSLEDLSISQNKLTQVPVAIQGLGQLKTLDIGENRINSVSNESFKGLSQVYGLRLVDNRISELPPGFCDSMKNLRVVNSAQNKISRVSDTAFMSCPHVRALRLDSNMLQEIPLTLTEQLPSLLWLNVSDNRLEWVDYRLLPPTLEWLDASHNQLLSLTKPNFLPLKRAPYNSRKNSTFNLRVLDASYNKLTVLDQTLIPPMLDTLRVNHAFIKNIAPDTFSSATRLRRVELIGNEIESLPLSSIRFYNIPKGRRLPEIYLGDNPFLCECSMEWLTRVNQLEVLRQYPRIVDLNSILCRPTFPRSSSITTIQRPQNNRTSNHNENQVVTISLLEAQAKDFLCPYTSHCFALCHCCEFEFCDCQNFCPDNCTCYHDSSWSQNIVECSNLQYNQVPPRIPMDATEIYLDGNQFGNDLSSHIFIGKKNLRALYLNNSNIESLRNKTFNGLKSLEILHLQNNLLQQIEGYEFADVTGLKELYLQNNLIRTVSPGAFQKMSFLQVLRLDGNFLVDYNVWELTKTNGYLHSLMISGNRWSCECSFIQPMRRWVASLKNTVVVDYPLVKCFPKETSGELETNTSESATTSTIPPSPTGVMKSTKPTLISAVCNNNPNFMNNHISSVGGVQAPTGAFGSHSSGPYLHAHLENENSAGNYKKEFPRTEHHENPAAAAGERGGRRSSKAPTDTDGGSSFSENSTFLICLATFIAIILVASVVFLFGLLRKRGMAGSGSTGGSGSSWWCCFTNCGINGGSAMALAKCLSAQNQATSNTPNEGESNEGTFPGSYYYSESGKLFDAYFIYSQQDEEFVEKLTAEMEQGLVQLQLQHYYPPSNSALKLKLLFQRDLCLAPPWNSEMIQSACDASKRIVLIISNNFLNLEWANAHFRGALLQAIHQNWRKLIVIKLHDDGVNEDYWNSILAVCNPRNGNNNNKQGGQTYTFPARLDWTDTNFWPKFKLLLPQSSGQNNRSEIPPGNNFPTLSSTTSQQLPYSTHLNMNGINILNPSGVGVPYIPYQISQNQPQNFVTLMNWSGQQGFPLSHLAPTTQHFGYSNIDSFQNPQNLTQITSLNNHNLRTSLRHNHNLHNAHQLPPQPQPPNNHHRHHSHDTQTQHIHSLSQLSSPIETNYSSSAVSSGNDEFDHVYSTLDSPLSDMTPQFEVGQMNRHQIQHSHSNSSGISSGSDVDATSGSGGAGCHHPVPPMYFV